MIRLATMMVASLIAAGVPSQQPAAPAPPVRRPASVLFLCPHGAAKSILASAYFSRLAKERGLNVRVDAAGTEPDPEVSGKVAEHLRTQGYLVPVDKPRRVTPQDLKDADLVISLGCDLRGQAVEPGKLREWNDVPGPGENLPGADTAVRQRVMALVEEMLARERR